jgi:hypothetical protein
MVRMTIFSNPLLYVAIGLVAAVIVAVKIEFGEVNQHAGWRSRGIVLMVVYWLIDVALVSIGLFIVFLIVAFPITLASLWPRVAHAMAHPLWRVLGLGFLLGLAWAVYFFKTLSLRVYAVVEILVGLMIAWSALGSEPAKGGGFLQGIALAGSVYALASGIGDFLKGQEESRKPLFPFR